MRRLSAIFSALGPSIRAGLLGHVLLTLALLGAILFGGAALVMITSAQPASDSAGEGEDRLLESHRTALAAGKGYGLVFEASKSSCGCPKISDFAQDNSLRYKVPSRCLPENRSNPARPMNSKGYLYPPVTYPADYPTQQRADGGGAIPFPGWPYAKLDLSKAEKARNWNQSRRNQYLKNYEESWGGTHPWERPQPLNLRRRRSQAFDVTYTLQVGETVAGERDKWVQVKRGQTDWIYESIWHIRPHWQVHHIMERQFGGTNHPGNLVPVYSFPDRRVKAVVTTPEGPQTKEPWEAPPGLDKEVRTNLHANFTIWWENIIVDTDCRENHPDLYDEIFERMIKENCVKDGKVTVLTAWPE